MLIINKTKSRGGTKLVIALWGSLNPENNDSSEVVCHQDIRIKGNHDDKQPTTIREEAKRVSQSDIDKTFESKNFKGITDVLINTYRSGRPVKLNGSAKYVAGMIMEHIPKGVNVEVKLSEISFITGEKFVATGGKK